MTTAPRVAHSATRLRPGDAGIWISAGSAPLSYPEHGNAACYALEDRSFWFKHRSDCIVAAVRRLPPGGCILDVGGGNGFVTRRLLDEGFAAALLEPGPVGARNAKLERQIPEVICATLEGAGFARGSLSAVGCFDVIEHVADDATFLRQLNEVLAAGGLLYATVPAHAWLWSQADDLAGHQRRYRRAELAAALTAAGFELCYFTYFFTALLLPILLLRALPYRLSARRPRALSSEEAEHGAGGGPAAALIARLLRGEVAAIARGHEAAFGASALLVARKRAA